MKLKNRVWSRKNISNETQQVQHGIFHSSVEQSSISKSGEYSSSKNIQTKIKKPIYKRPWFVLLVVFVVLCILISVFNSHKSEKIVWSDMVMGSMLPEPPSDKGKIYENTKEKLWIEAYKVSEKQYSDYIIACEAKGFNVDAENEDYTYEAYDKNGYKLELSCYDDELSVELDSPIKMGEIKWPPSKLGELLPEPKSKNGNFSYETDTDFEVYIADTSIEDYKQYVDNVQKAGFNVDYNKSEKYFDAKNADGYGVTVEYEGYNIMLIRMNSPDENDLLEDDTTVTEKKTESTTQNTTTKTTTVSTAQVTPTVLTVKNCPELKKILELEDPEDPDVKKFAEEHYGDTIKFDGCIVLKDNYSDYRKVYKTRYNIMFGAGNFDENSQKGPNFRSENVGDYEISGFHEGQNVVVEATVGDYNENTTIFTIDLVSLKDR